MWRRGGIVGVAAVAGLLLAACEGDAVRPSRLERSPGASPQSSSTLVVGLVGTLSGPDSWRGEDALEGADLAVHELNRRGRRPRARLELVTRDDRGDPSRAVRLVGELADIPRSIGIVYAGPPTALSRAEPALAAARLPAILCYGELRSGSSPLPHLFQASPPLLSEARRIGSYLRRDRRYESLGAVLEDSAMGGMARRALRRAGALEAGSPVELVDVGARVSDLVPALGRLRRRRVEGVVAYGSPELFGRVLEALEGMGARYRGRRGARAAAKAPDTTARDAWRPQVAGFDLAISPRPDDPPPGTVAADSYARGAHYLPVAALPRFRTAFRRWWGAEPLGWEIRAYQAVRAVSWAARRSARGRDLAGVLERLRDVRLGGPPVTLARRDHVMVDAAAVGLWTVPAPAAAERDRELLPERLPWVPLARGFSDRRGRTRVPPADREALFRGPVGSRPPRFARMRFGVTTPASDPVH